MAAKLTAVSYLVARWGLYGWKLAALRALGWRGRVDYSSYLASPAWRRKRRAALGRAGHRCENCGAAGPLDVHHLTYVRLGRERAADLMALCKACHKWVHADRGRRLRRKTWLEVLTSGSRYWTRPPRS